MFIGWFNGNKRTGSFFVQFPAHDASSVATGIDWLTLLPVSVVLGYIQPLSKQGLFLTTYELISILHHITTCRSLKRRLELVNVLSSLRLWF